VGKLREQILAMRALWSAWQTGERLNYRGEEIKLTLMTPFFNPGPIDHPEIPVYIAGVNVGLCQLAGQLAEGFHVHPYHSTRYLQQVIQPAIASGAEKADRDLSDVRLSITAMVATDEREREFVRSQIAFYASTPSYRPVMEIHGWGEVADRLRTLSRHGKWLEMADLVSDEMLNTYAVLAPADELGSALKDRYASYAHQLTLYTPFQPGERDDFWRRIVEAFRGG
jgi:probable F420-dependent oxidoreductase